MANNRMYILHRPSGKAVLIAKRMAFGWGLAASDLESKITELFRMVEDGEVAGEQDDFCLAMETIKEGATLCDEAWDDGNENANGLRSFTKAPTVDQAE